MSTELMAKMVDNIELQGKAINALIDRIEKIEKTIKILKAKLNKEASNE